MNLMPHLILWAVITLIVVCLALYRKRITRGEDDTIHVLDGDQRYVVGSGEACQESRMSSISGAKALLLWPSYTRVVLARPVRVVHVLEQ